MYSIFNCKSKKLDRLDEGEPPSKKIHCERDILIKEMSKKQLDTNLTLSKQMNNVKQFEPNGTFLPLFKSIYGLCNLNKFKQQIHNAEQLSQLKKLNLSNEDARLCYDFEMLSKEEFEYKYRNVNSDILSNKLEIFGATLGMRSEKNSDTNSELVDGNLLGKVTALHPIDTILGLEGDFSQSIANISHTKVRKKLRNLSNKIKHLESLPLDTASMSKKCSYSLWDVKETAPTEKIIEVINKDKIYSCKPQNLYTIRDGVIVKLNNRPQVTPNLEVSGKLSVNQIREMPKFKNWMPGQPSINVFLKNLPKSISEVDLKPLLANFPKDCFSIRIMDGKMKGQAFIQFQDIEQASKAIDVLNGTIIGKKPIICQFGKRRENL